MDEYMSGDELYRFLHISKRKMKYLLENGYIPTEDTGMKTHRYKVKRSDAEAFRVRMERESDLLAELTGKFSSKKPDDRKKKLSEFERVTSKFTKDDCLMLRKYLTKCWASLPDAISVQTASELISCQPIRIYTLIEKGKLFGAKIGSATYCSKSQFIEYVSSLDVVRRSKSEEYHKLVLDFAKQKKSLQTKQA